MHKYKEVLRKTTVLEKIVCDTCGKEIHKLNIKREPYLPSTIITAKREFSSDGWVKDSLDFCSIECFLSWAKTEQGSFNIHFPRETLNKLTKADMVEEVME